MKKFTCSIITIMLFLLYPLSVSSQVGYLYINQYGGNVIKIARNEVASITFGSEAEQDFNINFDILTKTGESHTNINYTGNDFVSFQDRIEDVGYCYCLSTQSEYPTLQNNYISCKSSTEAVVQIGKEPYLSFTGKINGEIGNNYSVRAYIIVNGTTYYSYTRHFYAEKTTTEDDQIIISVAQEPSCSMVTISIHSIINGVVFPNAGFIEYGTSS